MSVVMQKNTLPTSILAIGVAGSNRGRLPNRLLARLWPFHKPTIPLCINLLFLKFSAYERNIETVIISMGKHLTPHVR